MYVEFLKRWNCYFEGAQPYLAADTAKRLIAEGICKEVKEKNKPAKEVEKTDVPPATHDDPHAPIRRRST